MVITAVIDRIENGNVFLVSDEIGVEISIPAKMLETTYGEGELLSLSIDVD